MDDYEFPPHLRNFRRSSGPSTFVVLKRRGHELLRRLEAAGIDQNDCYEELHVRLGWKRSKCHFSAMRTLPALDKAISVLQDLCAELKV